uniref:Uncharacterized protein n=1 Tax=viral metagenome TaxID=1070528 RepID=A0A6C0K315_9ZZZZ
MPEPSNVPPGNKLNGGKRTRRNKRSKRSRRNKRK